MITFAHVLKANPYHDHLGRFTTKARAAAGADRETPDWHNATKEQINDYMLSEHGVSLSWGSDGWWERKLDTVEKEREFREEVSIVDSALKGLPLGVRQRVANQQMSVAPLKMDGNYGLAFEKERIIGVSTSPVQFDARWSLTTRAVVMGQRAAQESAAVHEVAHILDRGRAVNRKAIRSMAEEMGGKEAFRAWVEKNVSKYATRNASEFLAESFTLYHTRYKNMSDAKKAEYPASWIRLMEKL